MIEGQEALILAIKTQAELNRLYMLRDVAEIEADNGEYEYGQMFFETLQSITSNVEEIVEELKMGY